MLVRVLGAPAIVGASGVVPLRGRRQAALLGLLTLDLGRPISRGRLEEELWGDVAVSDAALRVVVNRVRQHFADAGVPDLIRGERSGYRLDCAPDDVDATWLGAVAAEVADAERRGDDEAVVGGGEAAAGLWMGDPFAGVDDLVSLQAEAARLRGLRADVAEAHAASLLRIGHAREAEVLLRRLTAEEPFRERGWALLMVALHHADRVHEAVEAYGRIRHLLEEGLGVGPSQGLLSLVDALRTGGHTQELCDALLRRRETSAGGSPPSPSAMGGVHAAVVKRWRRRLGESRVCVLGPTGLYVNGTFFPVDDPGAGALLATLVTSPGGRMNTGDTASVSQKRLDRFLKSVPGAPRVRRRGTSVQVDVAGWHVDARLAGDMRAEALELLTSGPATASWLLEAARALWREPTARDDTSSGAAGAHWSDQLRHDVEDDHVAALVRQGALDEAEERSRRLLEEEPHRDRRWAQLIAVLASQGRDGDALAAFREARARYVTDLGRPPGASVELAEQAVLSHTDPLQVLTPPGRDDRFPMPPAPTGALVGRERETLRCDASLADGSRVLITGAPGVGKTRLALEVAVAAAARGAHVAWVDMRAGPQPETLRGWVDDRGEGLVVIDNAEADIDGTCAPRDVCSPRPSPSVMVTSRLPIELDAIVVALRPLGLPQGADPEAIETSDAVVLLRSLCQSVAPQAQLSSVDVAAICHRAGGIPLALRIAAERARRSSPGDVAAVPIVPDALADGVLAVLAELDEGTAAAFRALAMLPGPFDQEIAAVATGADEATTVARLGSLVEHALLEFDVVAGAGTYGMLEPLRDIAQSTVTGEERGDVFARLAYHCLERTRRRLTAPAGDPRQRFVRTSDEVPIYEAVLRHLATQGDDVTALELASALDPLLYGTGRWAAKNAFLDLALSIAGAPSAARARAHAARGRSGLLHLIHFDHLTAARSMAAAVGDRETNGTASLFVGIGHWWAGRPTDALDAFAHALEVAGDVPSVRSEVRKYAAVTRVTAGHGDVGIAELTEVVTDLEDRPPLRILAAHARMYLGHCRRHIGDIDAAIASLRRAAEVWDEVDNTASAIHTHAGLAELHADRGDIEPALRHASRALALGRSGAIDVYAPWVLCTIARVHLDAVDDLAATAAAEAAVRSTEGVWRGERHRVAAELSWVALRLGRRASAVRLLQVAETSEDRRELPFRGPNEAARLEECRRTLGPVPRQPITLTEAADFSCEG